MFSTDLDLTAFGPWYGNPNANLPHFIESIKKLLDFKMDVICTSHTYPLRNNIQQAIENFLNIIFEREERILGLLDKRMTLKELGECHIIYKKEQKKNKTYAWFELNMLKKHLERLIELDKVECIKNSYMAV